MVCEPGNTRSVFVKIPADLSCTGEERWKHAQIDSCIADIVEALQQGGVDMRSSCCGHGKTFGNIQLQDGRVLLILIPELGNTCIYKGRGDNMLKQLFGQIIALLVAVMLATTILSALVGLFRAGVG